jgi:STE24 endopeptidase
MQLLLIGLIVGLLVHDAVWPTPAVADRSSVWLWAAVLGPKLAVVGAYALWVRLAVRRLGRRPTRQVMRGVSRAGMLVRLGLLASFAMDLWLGLLWWVRGGVGNPVLLDEVLVLLPTLAAITISWRAYWPIYRRLNEAAIFERADRGLPVYPTRRRWLWVADQARQQLGLVLLPLLALLGWGELLAWVAHRGWATPAAAAWASPAGAITIVLLAPAAIRRVWDTAPLPAGPMRQTMEAMVRRANVRVRELLVWRTHTGGINAAVLGLVYPVRYVLLSDGLLEQLPERRVQAVMAHELAHVRLRHGLWLLLAAAAGLVVLSLAVEGAIRWLPDDSLGAASASGSIWAGGLLAWLAWFGWVSRRVERQADTWAARWLAVEDHGGQDSGDGPPARFTEPAIDGIAGALLQLAELNHIPPKTRSYRHGSIASRVAWLRSLSGQPVRRTRVDRTMLGVQAGSIAVVAIYGVVAVWQFL